MAISVPLLLLVVTAAIAGLVVCGVLVQGASRVDLASCVPYWLPDFIPRSKDTRARNCSISPLMEDQPQHLLGNQQRTAVNGLHAPWEGILSDDMMGTFLPILVYWLYAGLYHLLPPLNQYRMHSRTEEESRNLVPLPHVVKGVLIQQAIQAAVAFFLFQVTGSASAGKLEQPSLMVQVGQILVAMLIMDAWQYFVHRFMHHNKFLYRHVHSQHHRLVVPYAIGALYNHPLEGLLLDTAGGGLSFLLTGMTPRTAVWFFCFATIKTVDDHCGLMLPYNPFHYIFHNNTAYHDIHHQLQGTKYNFSQPFFVVWDKLLGTHMPFSLVKRVDGGFEAQIRKECKD
eukprot:TRINITY_DN1498_c0_g1_i1.p1 TRINITY_DN1498_c0_g1~~TRINITY_DN1498_c0_g1_i1.p1  ORF type:complete len:342 (+),score=35.54 TRINITY_DN1498_c0_g1_i1:92-1117(+)